VQHRPSTGQIPLPRSPSPHVPVSDSVKSAVEPEVGLNVNIDIDNSKSVGYGVVTTPEVGAVVLVISETTKSVGFKVGLNVGKTVDCIDIDNSKSVGYRVITSPVVGGVVLVIPARLNGTVGSTVGLNVVSMGMDMDIISATFKGTAGSTVGLNVVSMDMDMDIINTGMDMDIDIINTGERVGDSDGDSDGALDTEGELLDNRLGAGDSLGLSVGIDEIDGLYDGDPLGMSVGIDETDGTNEGIDETLGLLLILGDVDGYCVLLTATVICSMTYFRFVCVY